MERKETPSIHALARLLYWASLLLLLVGAWLLIDPLRRKPGETAQIYITLGAFELYGWLLLGLGRWQIRHHLTSDAARGGVLAAVLTGLGFLALNEMHMNHPALAQALTGGLVVLALAKLALGPRWLGLTMPWPLRLACVAWLAVLAGPPILVSGALEREAYRHALGYLSFAAVGLVAGGHLLGLAWQVRQGWGPLEGRFRQWWAPWMPVAALALMGILQQPAVMRAGVVDWAGWYLSPALLAGGVWLLGLSLARGRERGPAAILLGVVILACLLMTEMDAPGELPASWQTGAWRLLTRPLLLDGLWLMALLVGAAWAAKRLYLLAAAAVPAVGFVGVQGVRGLASTRHGPALTMLLGAFALLGGGAALQWYTIRHPRNPAKPLPPPPPRQPQPPVELQQVSAESDPPNAERHSTGPASQE